MYIFDILSLTELLKALLISRAYPLIFDALSINIRRMAHIKKIKNRSRRCRNQNEKHSRIYTPVSDVIL